MLTLCSLTVFLTPSAQAAPRKAAKPAPPAHRVLLPEYTPVRIRLMQDLKSGDTPEGEVVSYEVLQNVYAPGHILVIPAGSPAVGRVLVSKSRNSVGLSGQLTFTCNYMTAPDQTHVPVRTASLAKNGLDLTGVSAGAFAFTGGLIALAIKGGNTAVYHGQVYLAYVDQDTTLFPAPPSTKAIANGYVDNATILTLNNGQEIQGKLLSFDGRIYKIQTADKVETIAVENVASTRRMKEGARGYVPDAPKAERGGPEIEGLPRPVEITMINNDIAYGMLLGYDGYVYVLNTFDRVQMIEASDVQSVHFQGGVHKKHGPLTYR